MSKYEREWATVGALHEGDVFELPSKPGTICKVVYTNLSEVDEQPVRVISYSIVEGPLHWPVIYCPNDYPVVLLLPTTTYVKLSGKDWVNSLTEHHGIKDD